MNSFYKVVGFRYLIARAMTHVLWHNSCYQYCWCYKAGYVSIEAIASSKIHRDLSLSQLEVVVKSMQRIEELGGGSL